MKAQCLICAELFIQSSVISATSCGHLFHHECLLQWHEQSKTCPNCRTKLGSRDVIAKLFLDSTEGDSTISDENDVACAAALRNENNDLVAQLRECKNAKHNLIEDGMCKDFRIEQLENELRKSADMLKKKSQKKKHYKVQLKFLKKENTRLEAAEMELVVTKKELETYVGLQSMLEGSSSQTEQILKSYSKDPASLKQLATYCSLLQKELTDMRNTKARLQEQVKGLKSDLAAAHGSESKKNSLITTLKAEIAILKESLEASEHELQSVNNKMESLHNKMRDQAKSRDTSFDRFILESPAPRLSKPSQGNDLDSPIFLGINRLKRRNKDKEVSTHLKSDENKPMKTRATCVQASDSVIEISTSSSSSSEELCQNFNIFKRSRCPAFVLTSGAGASSSTRSRDGGYDGFGGHSKPDVFPSGNVGAGARRKVPIRKKNIKVPKSSTDIRFFADLID